MIKVFVNGTFDILHPGHVDLLNYAKSCGDYLLVAIDCDKRVRSKKGAKRPVNTVEVRKKMLCSLKPVDQAVHFGSDKELINIVKQYQPQIMVVGSDYCNKPVIGSEHAEKLIFFEKVPSYSTTNIINQLLKQ